MMKRYILLPAALLATASALTIWGNQALPTPTDEGTSPYAAERADSLADVGETQAELAMTSDETEASGYSLGSVIPPSLQAAAITRYAEYPVSHTTGIPDISVPLYEIDLGGYTLPISINYHASGARPDDMPGYVGTGWTLSAGGTITRTILGKPDRPMTASDCDLTCYDDVFVRNMLMDISKTGGGQYHHYLASILGSSTDIDTESDRYTFNVAGKTGVFRYSRQDGAYVILNGSNWLVESYDLSQRQSFRIVTNDGFEYEFGQEERTGVHDEALERTFVTAWHLTRIDTPFGEVRFEYDLTGSPVMMHRKEVVATSGPRLDLIIEDTSSGETEYLYETHSRVGFETVETILSYEQRPLKEITWSGGRVVFEYADGHQFRTLKRLTAMKVLDTQDNLRKSIVFDNNDNWPSGDSLTGRRLLVGVSDSENGNWSFGYDRSVKLPDWDENSMCHTSTMTDFWGFLNTSKPSLRENVFTETQISWLGEISESPNLCIGSRDRSPSLAHTRAGVLTEVNFPTGGKVTYDYELNSGRGGLRVKSQTTYEGAGSIGKKTSYEYMDACPATEPPEMLCSYISHRQLNRNDAYTERPELGVNWPYDYRTCDPFPVNPVTAPTCLVSYATIKEIRPDGSSVTYEYDQDEFCRLCGVDSSEFTHPSLFEQSLRDYGIWEPLLIARTLKDPEGNQIRKETFTYDRLIRKTISTGVRTECPYVECVVPPYKWGPATTVTPALVAKFGVFQHRASTAYVRANLLTSTTVTECRTGFSTSTEYEYDGSLRTMQPRTVTECGSDGVDIRTEYTYPFDMNDDTSSRMVEFFYMTDVPVGTSVYAGTQLLARNRTEYGFYNDWCYPVANRSWSAPTASSLQSPPSVLPEGWRVTSYNAAGRPLSVRVNETDVTSFAWNEQGNLLQSSTAPGGLVTKYTHRPLFGLASVTRPNGYVTSYTYNSAGMLSKVSDTSGPVESYSYSICGHPTMNSDGNSVTTMRHLGAVGGQYVLSRQYYTPLGLETTRLDGGMNTSGKYLYVTTGYDTLMRPCETVLPGAGGTVPEWKPYLEVTDMSKATNKEEFVFRRTTFDALGRPVWNPPPGDAWHAAGKGKTTQYIANAANSVRLYRAPLDRISLVEDGYYAARTLQGIRTVDEDGNEMTVYTDRLGRKVLERRGPESRKGQNDTYFVYNALGQLRYVLSPGYELSGYKDKFAYEYRYDEHGNVVKKFIPGAGYTQYWYDRAGRLAFMQDPGLRERGEHRFFVYDRAGRLAVQGVSASCNRNEAVNFADYTGGTTGFLQTGYTLRDASRLQQVTLETVNYYDAYTFASALDLSLFKSGAQPAKGLQTGSVVYGSDGKKSLSAIYYDVRGNVTESRERTPFGTLRTTVNTYTYSGQPLKSTVTEGSVTTITENTYHAGSGLLTATDVTVNGVKQRVSAVEYDDLGRIMAVTRGTAQNSGGRVEYEYNIHGQTTGIKGPGLTQNLYYADGPGNNLYNGSVSAMTWTMGTDARVRGYKYTYNGYGWLTAAEYGENPDLGSNRNRYTERFLEFMLNGGVRRLQRHGLKADGIYGKVDNLHISYDGNRITSVLEDADPVTQNGSMDYPGTKREMEFGYNEWGALVRDESRGITDITYDRSGNPIKISYSDGSCIENVYSATGEKLKATHATSLNGTVTGRTTTEYRGNVIYRDGKVDMILFPGGYATIDGTAVTFHYYTQDYLGNNRAVINGSTGAIEQTTAYYPYGGIIADLGTNAASGQPYKFGGKELITANGLNEYDFGARQYYSAVPGFTRPDQHCEKYYWLSPYLYCANNPVNFVYRDGRDIWSLDEEGHVISSDSFDGFDMLLVYDKHMKATSSWIGEYGSIKSQSSRISGSGIAYTVFESVNDEIGSNIFEFLADNISVEWSQLKTGMDENSSNYISTSHSPAKESSSEFFIKESLEGVNIRADIHSHPNGSDFPSGMDSGPNWTGDIGYAKWLESFAPEAPEFFIYLPNVKEYINFNSNSNKYDFPRFFNSLPPINISPTKLR